MSIHTVNVRSWNSGSNYVREDKVLILRNLTQVCRRWTDLWQPVNGRRKLSLMFLVHTPTNPSWFKWRHDRKTSPTFANTFCCDFSSVVAVIFRDKYNKIASLTEMCDWVTPFSIALCEKLIVGQLVEDPHFQQPDDSSSYSQQPATFIYSASS